MKRIFFSIFFSLLIFAAFSQSARVDTKILNARQWIIYQGDTLAIADIRGDTLFLTRGAELDTLVVGDNVWNQVGDDIFNTNAGYVIIDSLMKIYPLPPEASPRAIGRVLGVETNGQVKWSHWMDIYEEQQDSLRELANSGQAPAGATWVRDTTNGTLYTADSSDIIQLSEAQKVTMESDEYLHSYAAASDSGYNSFFGRNAGNFSINGDTVISGKNFGGSYNTGIGAIALTQITKGWGNTAVGAEALQKDTSGFRNTAVGFFSLKNNSSGYYNTGIGTGALSNNYVGYQNTALGDDALHDNDGNFNVALGSDALFNNTSGGSNVAVGTGSQRDASTWFSNVSVGESSLYTPNGSSNTAIGHYALGSGTPGNYNTALGREAGAITTGSNSVYVGYTAGAYNSAGSSLYIDGIDRVNSVGGKSKSMMFGTFNSNQHEQNLTINANVTLGDTVYDYQLNLTKSMQLVNTINDSTGIIYKAKDRYLHNFKPASNDGYNTFLGIQAGNFTMTSATAAQSSYNVGIGDLSLSQLTTGFNNIGIGYKTGYGSNTMNNSIAIGYQSQIVSNASYNVGIGSGALYSVTNGGYNVGIGANSLSLVTTGNRNIAIGHSALKSNTGSYNVSIGMESGYGQTSGDNNTIIGAEAATSNTTGDGNIMLGYQAGYNETGSNKLYIENSNATAPTAQIYGEFDNNYVNVYNKLSVNYGSAGSAVPGENFYVNGSGNIDGSFTNDNDLAELFEDASNVTATTATYKTIVSLQSGSVNNCTLTDSTITITQTGLYLINYSCSFTHSVNSTLVHISLFVDDVEDTSMEAERKIGTGGDYGSMSATCIASLSATDVLKLKTKSDNNGNLTIAHMNWNLVRIK